MTAVGQRLKRPARAWNRARQPRVKVPPPVSIAVPVASHLHQPAGKQLNGHSHANTALIMTASTCSAARFRRSTRTAASPPTAAPFMLRIHALSACATPPQASGLPAADPPFVDHRLPALQKNARSYFFLHVPEAGLTALHTCTSRERQPGEMPGGAHTSSRRDPQRWHVASS